MTSSSARNWGNIEAGNAFGIATTLSKQP